MAENGDQGRQQRIVDVFVETFDELMSADPDAFRSKFRKMAANPFAFYRGSAPLFYAVQGDLHAENFGTYLAGDGPLAGVPRG